MIMTEGKQYIRRFETINNDDVAAVGGKNASLGEMISALKAEGIRVPDGFAITAGAYRSFLAENGLVEKISDRLDRYHNNKNSLSETGKAVRNLIRRGKWPPDIAEAIRRGYRELCTRGNGEEVGVAVRSSATAEDLPEASFAGQQETYLNVTGEKELLAACRRCYASLFTDRAISYRENRNFNHLDVALSVGVQQMVRSDKSGSGVMFSIDTDSGFPRVIIIDAAWGLGENVVQGAVNPDGYMVYKPLLAEKDCKPILQKRLGSKKKKMVYAEKGRKTTRNIKTSSDERRSFVLSDAEILKLARWGAAIEKHYRKPMDMEWAKDGESDELYIVQARPETVQSARENEMFTSYRLEEEGRVLLNGLAIGQAIVGGKVQIIKSTGEIERFKEGNILVTGSTDPDWVPVMKKAAGIITDQGGRTSHAAIVSRELGITAVIGTEKGTDRLEEGSEVTLSCTEGEQGKIYEGILAYSEDEINLEELPETRTQIMLNIASPGAAFRWWRLPAKGIGLARMEFIINNSIQIHPLALVNYDRLENSEAKKRIAELTGTYDDKKEYFIERLSQGIAVIAASQYPEPVIVRMSDFKTNEYADLVGGSEFEFKENNPMLGFRGANRYYSETYRPGFALECAAVKRVRERVGLDNVVIMIPFCRTLGEADRVLEVLAENGLVRGINGLEVYMMVEIPANVVLAEQFAERFDGFSIGSNDLTQLVLGIDRDSAALKELFDERDPAVKAMIGQVIRSSRRVGTKIGICGQAPSDYPDFAAFLVEQGIDSISLNPDSVIKVIAKVAELESRSPGRAAQEKNN